MTYAEAYEKLDSYGQTHILRYYGELTAAEQTDLLTQIDNIDFAMLARAEKSGGARGKISPIRAMTLDETEKNGERFRAAGLDAIRRGKVGAVLLAGGMGTRLGTLDPKGVYDIGLTKPVFIFERLIANLTDVVREAGETIELFVMTSDKNHDATVSFFNAHDFFGYDHERVHFFMQDMAPATDYSGKLFMESKSRIATSPNGNGGWFSSMAKAGMLDIVHTRGIEWLNVFAVDNVLQRICDPLFVGATMLEKCEVGAKVIRKCAPDEKVGVMCLEDGRPSIIEYYELTDELSSAKDANGDPAYNFGVILNYLFSVPSLEEILKKRMPLHIVEKKIAHIDDAGALISPDKPNGHKFETLVLDMIHLLPSCLPFEVVREKEFAPIKNKTGVDSVDSARELLRLNGVKL